MSSFFTDSTGPAEPTGPIGSTSSAASTVASLRRHAILADLNLLQVIALMGTRLLVTPGVILGGRSYITTVTSDGLIASQPSAHGTSVRNPTADSVLSTGDSSEKTVWFKGRGSPRPRGRPARDTMGDHAAPAPSSRQSPRPLAGMAMAHPAVLPSSLGDDTAGKIPFILGLGAGYMLGIHAGRAQYECIKTAASKVAEQPFACTRIDAASSHVKQIVRTQGEIATEKVADAVKGQLFGAPPSRDDVQLQPADAGQASAYPVGESS